jgi:hypothetical protein
MIENCLWMEKKFLVEKTKKYTAGNKNKLIFLNFQETLK